MNLADVAYDTEAFPNFWCAGFQAVDAPEHIGYIFELSERRNDSAEFFYFINSCERLIGFNNMAYDWPMIHHFFECMSQHGHATAAMMWQKNQEIFDTPYEDRHRHTIWRPGIPQIDLFLIHHLERFTVGLKQIEMTMRSESVMDLPYPAGTWLTHSQMDETLFYNAHDVRQTKTFFKRSKADIEFRENLGPEWINYNDGKIGKKFFEKELIKAGVKLYEDTPYGAPTRKRQTPRSSGVRLGSVILDKIRFTRQALQDNLEKIKSVLIMPHQTKGGFETVFSLDGFDIHVKLGGIHGSVERKSFHQNQGRIRDFDVTSYYPSISIVNTIFPEHLGPIFCRVYADLKQRRVGLSKKDPGRTTLKFSLNVPFGDSNSRHGIFFDPAYMLAITMNGQLMLCMLAEQFANAGVKIIQVNTDGVTIQEGPGQGEIIERITRWWAAYTGMDLEETEYSRMFIKDANNYIAETIAGERKRVGDYDYEKTRLGKYWQSNHSMLVVARAAEAVMLDGATAEDFIRRHPDPWDFLIFRKGKFELDGAPVPRNLRYYVSQGGGGLVSIYPPLAGKTEPRRIGVHAEGLAAAIGDRKTKYRCSACGAPFDTKGAFAVHNKAAHTWKVTPAMKFDGVMPIDIDHRYYLAEVMKLVIDTLV